MCPSDAKLLLGHLPAVFVGGTLGVGGLGTVLWGPWKGAKEVLILEKDRELEGSFLQPCARPSGHLSLPATWGLGGWSVPPPPA